MEILLKMHFDLKTFFCSLIVFIKRLTGPEHPLMNLTHHHYKEHLRTKTHFSWLQIKSPSLTSLVSN